MDGNAITAEFADRFNSPIIEEFRANGGQVGGELAGTPILLLHNVGARSGATRVNPMAYVEHEGRYLVLASKAGADAHPAWYHNLKANPDAVVEVGTETLRVRAEELTGAERDARYAEAAAAFPVMAEHQSKTDRVIPIIALTPTGG
ncbi:nitroreductase family deazaflavin-dependent oxidoreductase [Saccharopolyspora gloriosae]|uniref:Deazaflavin-dependent oxidoreductase (Nitroreductase family) n=1 Tax=Saccharopolyspora gloriosae TaxID=455344 RepID=A0A840NHD6_9PSEU|nr:nitroreductase family deazaflavin-dependent oxidoreductase [Saccharopolyspora gloriosae]MBB5071300.1 deazaflavin-dependent oxidoreductase (nitroreductase family) [Saccharopolyspora gloriosae]